MNKGTITTFLRYRYLLENLISRDLKVKYRRSFLGILWSLLNPILLMLVLNAVFSRIFVGRVENFPLFLITGQILFGFFTRSTSASMMSVISGAALMKKVYLPKYIFAVEKVLFELVNTLFSLVSVVVMLFMFRVPFHWSMFLFPVPLVTLAVFSLGFGLILATACVFFRDIEHLYSVFTTALMYLTPIIYPLETLGQGIVAKVVSINPLTTYITYFRNVVIYGQLPTAMDNIVCFGWAVVMLVIGLWFFKRHQDKFILHI